MKGLNRSFTRELIWLDKGQTKSSIRSRCKKCGFEIVASAGDGLEEQEDRHRAECQGAKKPPKK